MADSNLDLSPLVRWLARVAVDDHLRELAAGEAAETKDKLQSPTSECRMSVIQAVGATSSNSEDCS